LRIFNSLSTIFVDHRPYELKKSIFITGDASGISKATAVLFAKKGWFGGLFNFDETEPASFYPMAVPVCKKMDCSVCCPGR